MLRAFHAVSDMGTITFLREEETWSSIEYGGTTDFRSVDPDQYNLNFDDQLPGDAVGSPTRVATVAANVLDNHQYTVVVAGTYGNLSTIVYDEPWHVFDTQTADVDGTPEDLNAEVQIYQLAPSLGPVDVYIAAPGANLSPVQALGSVSYKDNLYDLIDEGSYQLILTPVGDPGTVLFTSETFAIDKQTRISFAILDGAGEGTYALKVLEFGDRSATFLDRNVTSEMRAVHAAPLTENVDIVVGDGFAAPLVPNLAEGHASGYVPVASGEQTLNITPAGDPGVFLAEPEVTVTAGSMASFYLVGLPGSLHGMLVTDANRRLAPRALVRVVDGASHFTSLDAFIVPPGANIQTLVATASVTYRTSSGLTRIDPGSYDIVLRDPTTGDVVFGPQTVQLSADGIYTVVATDGTDQSTASVLLLDDFAH